MWSLDIQSSPDGPWETVASKPSVEACKSEARSYHRSQLARAYGYRIFDSLGRLYQFSLDNRGWRMQWEWGNLQAREHITPEYFQAHS